MYRPLTTLSYLFNYAILGNGEHPAGYHAVNLLLHEANVILLFVLARRLVGRLWLAFSIAAIWAVHPVLTESVTNIVGRADLLGGLAVLAGLLLYLKSAEAAGWRRVACLAGLAVVTAAGAFSKESAVVLPGILAAYEIARWKKGRLPALLWGEAVTLVPIVAMLWQRWVVMSAAMPAEFPFVDNPITGLGFWAGRLTAIKVLAKYLWLTVWPARLSADYSYAEIPTAHGALGDWAAWAAVAAAVVLVALAWKYNRTVFFFACFAFLNLLPTSNLIFPLGTIMAERFLYLPAAGLVACIAIAADEWLPRPAWKTSLLILAVAGLGARTWSRNLDWKDDLTMAQASVRSSPESFKVHRLLATALYQADAGHANIDQVVAEGDRSVSILDGLADDLSLPEPWNLAAAWHIARGDLLKQGAEYETAARMAQRSVAIEAARRATYNRRHGITAPVPAAAAAAYRILASAYLRLGDAERALPAATEARAIDPSNTEAYTQIADAYLSRKRGEEAAMVLAEGMFVTSDPGLRRDLLALYQSGIDAKGCAVVPGPNGPALNPNCEMVRRDLCVGAARAHRQDFVRQLACPNQVP